MKTALPLTLLACALIASSCEGESVEQSGPAGVAVKFFEARKAGNCREVWPLYSAGTQENLRAVVHRRERERHGLPQAETPEVESCASTRKLKRGSARISLQQANEAVVAAELTDRVPVRRWETKKVVVTEELRLVREGEAWRVDLPRTQVGRPGSRIVEVGAVDVIYPERFVPGFADRLEATAVLSATRDTLESALRSSDTWALVLPAVEAAQSLESAEDVERFQLSFAGMDRTITVDVRVPRAKPADQRMQESTLAWDAEGGTYAPIYFRGSWTLQPHEDGSTRVTLLLILDTKQWPANAVAETFSAEHLAQAVLDLESAALALAQ